MPIKLQELQGVSVWVVTADGGLVPLNENLLGGSATSQIWTKDNVAGNPHKIVPIKFIVLNRFSGSLSYSTTDFSNPIVVEARSSDMYSLLGLKTVWDTVTATDKFAPPPYLTRVSLNVRVQPNSTFPTVFCQVYLRSVDYNNNSFISDILFDTFSFRPVYAGGNTVNHYTLSHDYPDPIRTDGVRAVFETWNSLIPSGTPMSLSGYVTFEFNASLP